MILTDAPDLRDAWRSLGRRPGFTIAAVLMLAVGLGVNVAGFAIIWGALYRPLPFPDPDRIVTAFEQGVTPFSPATFRAVQARTTGSFTAFAATTYPGDATLTGTDWTLGVRAMSTTPELFQVMGIPPLVGRTLSRDDDTTHNVVISYGLWRTRFGGDRAAIGQSILLDGAPWTVVGVMPDGVALPAVDVWRLLTLTPQQWAAKNTFMITAMGSLRPGVDLALARSAVVTAVSESLDTRNRHEPPTLISFRDESTKEVRDRLRFAQATLVAVLLIVCVNLASLLLAHGRTRDDEIAVRAALGATRARLIRQLAVEYLCLAALGSAGALMLATWCVRVVVATYPGGLPASNTIGIHPAEVAAVIVSAVLATLVFGLGPAIVASRVRTPIGLLSKTQTTEPRAARAFRGSLVVVEVALSLAITAGAALLVRSYTHLVGQPLGFDPSGLQTASISLPPSACAVPSACTSAVTDVLDRIARDPRTARVAGAIPMPFDRSGVASVFRLPAADGTTRQIVVSSASRAVRPDHSPRRCPRSFTIGSRTHPFVAWSLWMN